MFIVKNYADATLILITREGAILCYDFYSYSLPSNMTGRYKNYIFPNLYTFSDNYSYLDFI